MEEGAGAAGEAEEVEEEEVGGLCAAERARLCRGVLVCFDGRGELPIPELILLLCGDEWNGGGCLKQ